MAVKDYPSDHVAQVTADYVFRAVKAVIASGREPEFLALCKERDLRVAVGAEAANFVRGFLDEHARANLDKTLTKSIEGDTCGC